MEWLNGSEGVDRAIALLCGGELVAVPTETVYGLGASALNQEAVRRIFAVKGRPFVDPLIVHLGHFGQLEEYCEVGETARELADRFWPGPLTLVLPRRANCPIPDLVSAGKRTLAVRIPGQPLFRDLLCASELPIAAPSANPFGYVSPTRPEHVASTLPHGIAAILDGGPCQHGIESTIVEIVARGKVRLLRPGPIGMEELTAVAGIQVEGAPPVDESAPSAPGMLKSHYRPKKGVTLFAEGERPETENAAMVFLQRPQNPRKNDYWLSETGDLEEVAHNLFDLMRRLDGSSDCGKILMEMPAAETGLARAIRDRLQRAATPAE